MLLFTDFTKKIVVSRYNADVYDENLNYYTRVPVSNDCPLAPGEYEGVAVLDYITYKDKKTNLFKSFLVFKGLEEFTDVKVTKK